MMTNKMTIGRRLSVAWFSVMLMLGVLVGKPTTVYAQYYQPQPAWGQPQQYSPPHCDFTVVAGIGQVNQVENTTYVQGRSGEPVGVSVYCPIGVYVTFSYGQLTKPLLPDGPGRYGEGRLLSLSPGMPPLWVTTGAGQAFSVQFAVTPGYAEQGAVNAANYNANQALARTQGAGQHYVDFLLAALLPLDGDSRFTGRLQINVRFRGIDKTVRPYLGAIGEYTRWQITKSEGVPNVDRERDNLWNATTLSFMATVGVIVNLPPYVELNLGLKLGDWYNSYDAGVISQTQAKSDFGIPVTDFHACVWGGDAGFTLKPNPWFGVHIGYSLARNCTAMPIQVGPQTKDQFDYLSRHDGMVGLWFSP